jgi:hypothetical protein
VKFDLEQTARLATLFAVPREERHDTWREAFFVAVPDASLAAGDPQVAYGPDGYPYFQLRMPEPGPFETFCVTHVLDACLTNGFGVVVHGGGPEPEWVFTYGDLWSFRETGRFIVSMGESVTLTEERKALVGAPNESMLPPYARAVLRRALEAQGAAAPGVLLVRTPGFDPEWSFAFRPLPDLRRLLWYVPRHVGVTDVADRWPEPMPL